MQYKIININNISSEDYHFYYSLMSPEKQARVNRCRFEDDKKRTVAGEMLARKMIAEYLNVDIKSIAFYTNEFGKPFVKDLDIEFNISHSGKMVICAISNTPIGVDIEQLRSISDSVIKRVCTKEEVEYVFAKNISGEEKNKRFFEIWTFKEAYFKCLGTGITTFDSVNYFDEQHFNHRKQFIVDNYVICLYNISEQGAIR